MATSVPNTVFHRFAELPSELRLQIWEESILTDHKDLLWEPPSGVFGASHESRTAALGIYDLALPVRPFYPISSWGPLPAQSQTNSPHTGGVVQQGVVRVNLRLDIFLVSCDIIDFLREKMSTFEYADLVTQLPTVVPAMNRLSKAPRYMTTALTPAMCARIERVMEVHNVSALNPNFHATHASQVAHTYDATQFSGVRECFHVDNPFTLGGIRSPSRLLCHLGQGIYTSEQLLMWLLPRVCRV
ncbi:hypothetical protein PG991_002988 [Apiospora marii]|uniref:2EXR domain-containing protein n=1 Tax=Apiospora marii TaxID=335849 RepID=A0ABR1SIN5_9PEZI